MTTLKDWEVFTDDSTYYEWSLDSGQTVVVELVEFENSDTDATQNINIVFEDADGRQARTSKIIHNDSIQSLRRMAEDFLFDLFGLDYLRLDGEKLEVPETDNCVRFTAVILDSPDESNETQVKPN